MPASVPPAFMIVTATASAQSPLSRHGAAAREDVSDAQNAAIAATSFAKVPVVFVKPTGIPVLMLSKTVGSSPT